MFNRPKLNGVVVFVSMPSKGSTNPDSASTGLLQDHVYKALAKLHEKYPDHTFIVPMVQDYLLLKYLSKEPNWDNWGDHCRRLIERCDEMWVLLMDGWTKPSYATADDQYNTSEGVRGEIVHAAIHDVCVSYVDPTGL